MTTLDDLLRLATSGPLNYVCVRIDEVGDPELVQKLRSIGGVDSCSQCEEEVVVTPSVLAEHKVQAHALQRGLRIVCSSCVEALMDQSTFNIVRLPSEMEDAEAKRIVDSR